MRVNDHVIAPPPAAHQEPTSAASRIASICAAIGFASSIGAVIAIFLDLPLTTLGLGILAYYAFRAVDACQRRVPAQEVRRPEAVDPRAVEPQPVPAVEVRSNAHAERPPQAPPAANNVHGFQLTPQQQAAFDAVRETTTANLLFMEIQAAKGPLDAMLPKIAELIQVSKRAITFAEQSTENCREKTRKSLTQILQKLLDLVALYRSAGLTDQQRSQMATLMTEVVPLLELLLASVNRPSGVVS
ncbi:MAG: hypothetical protein ACOYKZ_05970 [Chlamydiia bacterium]